MVNFFGGGVREGASAAQKEKKEGPNGKKVARIQGAKGAEDREGRKTTQKAKFGGQPQNYKQCEVREDRRRRPEEASRSGS